MYLDQAGSKKCMKPENDNMKRVLFKGAASLQLFTIIILLGAIAKTSDFFKRSQNSKFLSKIPRFLDLSNGFKKI